MRNLARNSVRQTHALNLKRFFLFVALSLFCLSPQLSAVDISRLIDSIEQQNIYAHDTVKIKNYILLHEKLDGNYPDTSLYFIDKALKIDSLHSGPSYKVKLLLLKAQILSQSKKYNKALDIFKIGLDEANKENNIELTIDLFISLGSMYINLTHIAALGL